MTGITSDAALHSKLQTRTTCRTSSCHFEIAFRRYSSRRIYPESCGKRFACQIRKRSNPMSEQVRGSSKCGPWSVRSFVPSRGSRGVSTQAYEDGNARLNSWPARLLESEP